MATRIFSRNHLSQSRHDFLVHAVGLCVKGIRVACALRLEHFDGVIDVLAFLAGDSGEGGAQLDGAPAAATTW